MLGIGQVGLGQITTTHRDGYRRFGLPVVAGFDISPEARARFALEEPSARIYAQLEDLLEDPTVAVVDLATPHRREMRLPAIAGICQSGKPVLIQKPLAESYSEAVEMVQMLEKAGLSERAMVNQNMCFNTGVAEAANHILQGTIGTPFLARANWNWPMDFTEETWFGKGRRWWTTDLTVHPLSVLHLLLGPPETVYAVLGRDPEQPGVRHEGFGHLLLKYPQTLYPEGLCATIYSSGTHYGKPDPNAPFIVQGPSGVLELRTGNTLTLSLRKDKGVEQESERHQTTTVPGKWFPDAFGRTMAHFQSALLAGETPLCSVEDNLYVMAVVEAIYRSHATNTVIPLSEIMGDRWRADYGPGWQKAGLRPEQSAVPSHPDAIANGYVG